MRPHCRRDELRSKARRTSRWILRAQVDSELDGFTCRPPDWIGPTRQPVDTRADSRVRVDESAGAGTGTPTTNLLLLLETDGLTVCPE